MRFVISYDLNKPGKNYDALWAELARLNCKRILLSQWAGNLNNTALEVCNHFKGYIDTNDRLLVVALDSADWAKYNLMSEP